jgi:hypothetical protein
MSQFSIDPEIRSVSARTANELQQLNRRRVQLNVQVLFLVIVAMELEAGVG